MPIIKCKMCGGDLNLVEGSTVCECEYCGTKQTVPSADNEKKLTLFSRAGRLLRACEFDKAAGVFETIVADFPEEAEAYWGLVLCKYGIEYVDDPATGKKIPTCHRSSFDSVLDDSNFEQACENTDAVARRVYRDEARQIEELRQAILQVSGKEEPYDVFISYKETDGNGERTLDSVIAQDIYKELTREGYRVFFSRISLEDKLGTEYEPYIFAALNSAKVMLVVGTDYENFDAVWVKNEWSRFLKLIARGEKKTLIPVFKNMDAYDMPKEFAKLAAQDMGKVGAMQDLVRGVEKLVGKKKAEHVQTQQVVQQIVQSGGPNVTAMLKRGQQALEDSEWDKAKGFYDQVLSMDAENAEAFLGLALAENRCRDKESYFSFLTTVEAKKESISLARDRGHIDEMANKLVVPGYYEGKELEADYDFISFYESTVSSVKASVEQIKASLMSDRNMIRAFRYAQGNTKQQLDDFKARLFERLDAILKSAESAEKQALAQAKERYATKLKDADQIAENKNRAAQQSRETDYQTACRLQAAAKDVESFEKASSVFERVGEYRDAKDRLQACSKQIAEGKESRARAAAEQMEQQRVEKENLEKARAKKTKKIGAIIAVLGVIIIASVFVITKIVLPEKQYKAAEALYEAGEYVKASAAFVALDDYKDSATRAEECRTAIKEDVYEKALAMKASGEYEAAITAFRTLAGYKDSESQIEECGTAIKDAAYEEAQHLMESGAHEAAIAAFESLDGYKDSAIKIEQIKPLYHEALMENADVGDYVFFGCYEQDNNTDNGSEDIEWLVLAKENNRLLLISRNLLDCQPFNTENAYRTWETCSLREWLNNDFINTAFSAEEQTSILTVTVSTEYNPYYETYPGQETEDQVFLLSIQEAESYFISDEARRCTPTKYAKAQGVRKYNNWWLRSPGRSSNFATFISSIGSIGNMGTLVGDDGYAVRPALWVELG